MMIIGVMLMVMVLVFGLLVDCFGSICVVLIVMVVIVLLMYFMFVMLVV